MLVNLLHNAVKFTERGRVVLDVIVVDETGDDVSLRFEVRDTGIGIAEDQFDSVFDAFTQVDSSSTRRHGGSGLGLAIVKELAELMGGRVGVDSQLDAGSTFWFELTLKRGADPAPATPASEADAVPSARILLAEDDTVNQLVVAGMLEKWAAGSTSSRRRRRVQRRSAPALRPHVHGLPHARDGRLRGARRIRRKRRERGTPRRSSR